MPKVTRNLVNVHCPVIFNGKELTSTQYSRKDLNIFQFMSSYLILGNKIDVNPPYQRNDAWPMQKQAQFIASLFSDTMPIPPLYLCKKYNRPNSTAMWALDCRQRVTSMRNFIQDKFAVSVVLTYSDGKTKKVKLFWSEICADETYSSLKQNFDEKKLELVVFEPMELEDQRKVFTGLNSGMALNVDEQIYCNYFNTRNLCEYVFDAIFASNFMQSDLLTSAIRHKKRFRHNRVAHEIMILCADVGLEGEPEARATNKKDRTLSAKLIHEKLSSLKFNYGDPIDDSLLDSLHLKDKLPQLVEVADLLNQILTGSNTLFREETKSNSSWKSNVDSRNIVDSMVFLYKMVKEGKATMPLLNSKKPELTRLLKRYEEEKKRLGLNQSTTDQKVIDSKFKALEGLFFDHRYGIN